MAFARVTVVKGSASAVQFGRVVGGQTQAAEDSSMVIEEHPQTLDKGQWYLVQPPPYGADWFVGAKEPVTVVIERARIRSQRLVWTLIRERVFQWIDGERDLPDMPAVAGSAETLVRLRADAALGEAAATHFKDTPAVPAAMRLWRKAAANVRLAVIRRHHGPFLYDRDLIGDDRPGFGRQHYIYRGDKQTQVLRARVAAA